jgi:hypothetical protein
MREEGVAYGVYHLVAAPRIMSDYGGKDD